MKTYLLQTAIWPQPAVDAPELMYFRAHPRGVWRLSRREGMLYVPGSAPDVNTLEFSTFFGAFSLSTWCGSAGIDSVVFKLKARGKAILRIWRETGYVPRALLYEDEIEGQDEKDIEISLAGLKDQRGILYPQFETTTFKREFRLISLNYATDIPPRRKPKLAIIMPTYKREIYVRRNIALLSKKVISLSKNQIRLFVVDNGQTLNQDSFNGVTIIPNPNYGGTGGFARGVLAAMDDKDGFTHVLFCDDDVLIEPESVQRLYVLLGYIDDKTVVGGGMLNMREKHLVHEVGAYAYGTKFKPRKHLFDVSDISRLIDYDKLEVVNYYAWWFFAAPLKAFSDHGLPMPFFVYGDDIEFGIRLQQAGWKMTSLLGSAVWHDEFALKYTPIKDYYWMRNILTTAWLHDDNLKPTQTAMTLIRLAGAALLTYRYDQGNFLIQGAEDAIKGPSFLENMSPEEFHISLARKQTALLHLIEYVAEKYNRNISSSLLRKLAIILTLNGHLLPTFLMRKDSNAFEPGWTIEHLHSHRLNAIFRSPTVLYYEPISHQGVIYHMDRKEFFNLLFKLIQTAINLLIKHKKMVKQWREASSRLMTPKFWRTYLGLEIR